MKKRFMMTLTAGLLTGLFIGLGVPPQVATGIGGAINDQAWEAFEGEEAEGDQAPGQVTGSLDKAE